MYCIFSVSIVKALLKMNFKNIFNGFVITFFVSFFFFFFLNNEQDKYTPKSSSELYKIIIQ
jgi:hypothetical protein